jgi:hypothetical protein
MPLHRERTDPVRTPEGLSLAHRRWIVPDDVHRPVGLSEAARLWRGLFEVRALDVGQEVELERLPLPPGELQHTDLPAVASAGAILAGSSAATSVSQVLFPEEGLRDPYAADPGYRDYTLYVVDSDRFLIVPIQPDAILCGACGRESSGELLRFGQAFLLDASAACPACTVARELERDRVRLRGGAVFLLEEACARAALAIELPADPGVEEMPDPDVSALVRDAFGGSDELSDDAVEPA